MKKKMLIEEWIIAVSLCIMVLMVAGQVLSRYMFRMSISYTEELVRYFFVWTTFLGAAAAVYRRRHLSIAGVFRFIPARMTRWFRRFSGIGAMVFAVVLLIYGARVVLMQFKTQQTTAALGFPMWIVGLAVPVCSLVLIIRMAMIAADMHGDE